MAKRSQFGRAPRDYYPTPYSCVPALLPHLGGSTRFIEPCAGDGRLAGYLQEHGHVCDAAMDIEPGDPCIMRMDALYWRSPWRYEERTLITNPPWSRPLMHPMIQQFSTMHPTWLLIDMNWANTRQAAPYLKRCRKIVVIGRVKWIEDSKHQGKEDCGWFLFTDYEDGFAAEFYGRAG